MEASRMQEQGNGAINGQAAPPIQEPEDFGQFYENFVRDSRNDQNAVEESKPVAQVPANHAVCPFL